MEEIVPQALFRILAHNADGQIVMSMRLFNLCFISQEYPPDTGWGGIGTYTHNIARGLAELGHHVHVITRAVTTDGTTEWYDGRLRIHRVWHKDYPILRTFPLKYAHGYVRWPYTLDRPFGWGYGASKFFGRLTQETPIDVVEAPEHNADGLIQALSRWLKHGFAHKKCPKAVVKLHLPMLRYYALNNFPVTQDIQIINALERWTTTQADAITSPSRELAEIMTAAWRLRSGAITILPNPLDDDFFVPNPAMSSDEPIITFVGRLEPQKGVETLIAAFNMVLQDAPQAKLRLIGADQNIVIDGKPSSYQADLQHKLAELRIAASVEFVGKVPRSELPRYYQQSRVCAVPSKFENFPNVCLEAMACGRPVIASRVGGIPEIIEDRKQGLLVSSEDSEQFAEAILSLLRNREFAEHLGRAARKRIETKYSIKIIAQQTAQFYEALL